MTHARLSDYRTRPATQDDAETVCKLWNVRSHHVHHASQFSEANVLKQWDDPRFHLETDSLLVFDPQSTLIGYAHIRDVKNPPVDVFCTVVVHPRHDDHDWIWKVLLEWSVSQARRVIPKAPAGTRIALISGGSSADKSKLRRLEEYGFNHSRTFYQMEMALEPTISTPTLPEGIVVRPYLQDQDIEALVHASRDAFHDHYGHLDQPFETDVANMRLLMEEADFDPDLWFLAIDTAARDTVAGYCCCYPQYRGDDTVGLIDEVGVCQAYRRQGIGRALLIHSLDALQRRGLKRALLTVDSDNKNQAMTLYESVGLSVVSSSQTYVKELRSGENLVAQ